MNRPDPFPRLLPAVILDLIGFAMLLPLFPIATEELGANKWMLMLVLGSYSATQFVAAPWIGRLSDRIGRKPLLIVCYLGSAVGALIFAAGGTILAMLLSRVVSGVTGGNIPLAQAVVADSTPEDRRTRRMGLIGMSFGIGFILGPLGGGLAYRLTGSHAAPGVLAAALSALAALITFVRVPESLRQKDVSSRHATFSPKLVREAFRYPVTGTVLVVALLSGVAFSTFEATFSQFLSGRFRLSPAEIGPVFALIGVVIAVVQGGLVGRLAYRFGERRLVVVGLVFLAAGLAGVAVAPSLGLVMAAMSIFAVGGGVLNPSMSSLVPAGCPAARVGVMLGIFQGMNSLGRVVGPVWGQYARGTFGEASPYLSAVVLVLLAIVVAVRGVLRPAGAAA